MTSEWHLDDTLTAQYADGRLGPVLTASVEQHVMSCPACQARLAPAADPARLDRVWSEVLDRVEAPRPTLVQQLLERAGVDAATARLVAATPALRGAWISGVLVVLGLALVAAYASTRGAALFLSVAPLLPLAGVALAYGRTTDPAYEMAAAAPHSQLRLLVLRTAFVVATTLPPAVAVGLLLPAQPLLAAAWLLPALALTTGTVALSTRMSPVVAAGSLTAGWLALSAVALTPLADPLLVGSAPVQLGCLALAAGAALVILTHGDDLGEILRRYS